MCVYIYCIDIYTQALRKSGRIFTKMFIGVISRLWDDKQFFTFCFIIFGITIIVIPNCFPIIHIIIDTNYTIINHNKLNIAHFISILNK